MRAPLSPLVALAISLAAVPPIAAAEATIELEGYNRTYEALAGELEPYVLDPVRVALRSPTQMLTVRSNRVIAKNLTGGLLEGRVELDVLGKGTIEAQVDLGGVRETFRDEVILPPQTLVIPGKARLERVEGGYRVRVVELPERVSVAIQSRLVTSIVNLCGTAEVLTLGAVSCEGLERALTRPSVPIPREAGEVYLPDSELDAGDRAALDRLLAAAR
ncbi:MAG: hypothetical protein KDB94_10795 [Acidobacteria bacterium]|nr:hypothetical protein [Acidobacteriota bacterium]